MVFRKMINVLGVGVGGEADSPLDDTSTIPPQRRGCSGSGRDEEYRMSHEALAVSEGLRPPSDTLEVYCESLRTR